MLRKLRIDRLELKNFRAFYGEYSFDIGSKHLLIYGENGSGKSSLYHALYYMLNANQHQFNDHMNIFSQSNDGYIKLQLADQANPSHIERYEWTAFSQPNNAQQLNRYFTSSRFLDYKELLRVYYLAKERGKAINLFELMLDLLGDVIDSTNGYSIAQLWQNAIDTKPETHHKNKIAEINLKLSHFTQLLEVSLESIRPLSEKILSEHFNYPIQLKFDHARLAYDQITREIVGKTIGLKVRYRGKPVVHYHEFLNEAKLSAIALAMYFSALTIVAKTEFNVLALDDVLIGFDMSNRLPIIDILETYFKDYQIFFFTYDRAWFEMMRLRTQSKGWMTQELYCGYLDGHDFELPIVKGNRTYLQSAEYYLNLNDYKAAVIYLRTAFEELLKKFCSEKRLNVVYNLDNNKTSGKDLWDAAKSATDRTKNHSRYISSALEQRIEHHRTFLLNPVSHSAILSIQRKEVEDALNDIRELKQATEKKQSQP